MPKSASSAVSQAAVVAADILADVAGKPRTGMSLDSHCWSVVAPDAGVKLIATYKPGERNGKRMLIAGAISASTPEDSADVRKKSYADNLAWYDALTAAAFPRADEKPEAAPEPATEAPPKRRRRRRRRR